VEDQHSIQSETPTALDPLKKIGGLIRKAREERSLSIEELAGSLRIGQEQLIALENGEEDLLPEHVFIKAMIRRVAERLHLDLGDLISEFQTNTFSLQKAHKIEDSNFFPSLEILSNVPTWALMTGLIGIATSGFAITYLSNDSSKLIKESPKPAKVLSPKTKAIDSSYHIVAPGQTLTTISKFHEIPLETLVQINELNNPDKLKIGTKLSLEENRSNNHRQIR